MHARAADRIKTSRIPVTLLAGAAETLPIPSATCDTAVSTLTLCSVADPRRALRELRRVLADGGALLVVEHGLAEDDGVARWQHRLNGVQNVMACGCNLNRPIRALVEGSGFRFQTVRSFFVPKVPRTHGWLTVGTAVKG